MAAAAISRFQKLVWEFYREHRRAMPWRDHPTPYNVTVSELMLQQTQVGRVMEKYPAFIAFFPDFASLAAASRVNLLAAWQGLGYNRRALYLQRLAEVVVGEHGGRLPDDPRMLRTLPGVGPGTAGSIAAFAFDAPVAFVETNIRRVILHHFFAERDQVPDVEVLAVVEQVLDRRDPRQWYYALMDYGAALAKQVPNPNRRSKHYAIQSKFEGSDRQIRGAIIRLLLEFPVLTAQDVINRFPEAQPERVTGLLAQLTKEGFVSQR